MSTLEDRAREAKAARDAQAKTDRCLAEIEMEKRFREAQGEFVGDMAGAFGSFVGSRRMQTVISLIKSGMLLGFGAAAIAALYKVS